MPQRTFTDPPDKKNLIEWTLAGEFVQQLSVPHIF